MRELRVVLVTHQSPLADDAVKGLAPLGISVVRHDNLLGLYGVVLAQKPDVLIFDGDLPRLALEATARFLRSKAESARLPFVVLTHHADGTSDPGVLVTVTQAADYVDRSAGVDRLARVIRRLGRQPDDVFEDHGVETGEFKLHGGTPGRPTILIVDDDPSIAQLLKRILATRYDVKAVHDGASAIEACRAFRFDAIFCDLMMPGTSGADVYRAVRTIRPELADRIVFVTAHSLDGGEVEFFMGLSNHVVHKPFSMKEILAVAGRVAPVKAPASA